MKKIENNFTVSGFVGKDALCCDDIYVVIGIFTIENKLFVQHLHNIINRR